MVPTAVGNLLLIPLSDFSPRRNSIVVCSLRVQSWLTSRKRLRSISTGSGNKGIAEVQNMSNLALFFANQSGIVGVEEYS